MIPIIKWELWQRRWSIFWWSLGIAGINIITLSFYPAFRDQSASLNQVLSQIPKSALSLLSDSTDFLSPEGFLSSKIFYIFLPLLFAIFAISLGSSLIGREEKEGTIELLLSRPISRTKLLISKGLGGLFAYAAVGLVAIASIAGFSAIIHVDVPASNMALATTVAFLLGLTFGALAFFVTMFGRARSASIGVASLYGLGGYLIASFITTVDWLKYPAKLFPFDYYKPSEVLRGTYNYNNLIFIVGVTLVCAIASLIVFRKRDITS